MLLRIHGDAALSQALRSFSDFNRAQRTVGWRSSDKQTARIAELKKQSLKIAELKPQSVRIASLLGQLERAGTITAAARY